MRFPSHLPLDSSIFQLCRDFPPSLPRDALTRGSKSTHLSHLFSLSLSTIYLLAISANIQIASFRPLPAGRAPDIHPGSALRVETSTTSFSVHQQSSTWRHHVSTTCVPAALALSALLLLIRLHSKLRGGRAVHLHHRWHPGDRRSHHRHPEEDPSGVGEGPWRQRPERTEGEFHKHLSGAGGRWWRGSNPNKN